MSINQTLTDLGFKCEGTGGGCRAWIKLFRGDYHVMITGGGDWSDLPEDNDSEVCFGFYDPDGINIDFGPPDSVNGGVLIATDRIPETTGHCAALANERTRDSHKTSPEVEHALCDLLRVYAHSQKLEFLSADEMLRALPNGDPRETWLEKYISLWDESV